MLPLFALALLLLASSANAGARAYGASAIVMRDGYPVFTVRGRPFFIWGAAFFYERIPRERWRASLAALRALHVNTLDLYLPWNWHEPTEGNFDFDGHTAAERDVRSLLRLARTMGFYLIVRPGPVIRNEWRNGGYPAWLLRRPAYGMPLHDVLEGRYPATATLQNARSDDAAAEWMHNATHMRYAERWLRRALAELTPEADRVLAIQLDDDQGAYLTNQTWPAPHLRTYLEHLAAIVHGATDPRVPVFINTYQMKVTASSPVWAMGNWYQSEARTLGEHDRAQLAFSTALLGTRPRNPIVLSEFQAGWLLAPEDVYPRRVDPSNTLLALHTALGAGARGTIDFPMQDTLNPSGWEAPFANRFYAWDAALTVEGRPSPRYAPTAAFGALVARDGDALAATHPVADAAIAWLPSAYASISNDDVGTLADATIAAQRSCRTRELACALVDLRFADDATLARYRALILPALPSSLARTPFVPLVQRRLTAFERRGSLVRSFAAPEARRLLERRTVRGIPGATLHVGTWNGASVAFLDVPNFGDSRLRTTAHVTFRAVSRAVAVDVAPRSAELLRLDRPHDGARPPPAPTARPPTSGVAIRADARVGVRAIGDVVLESPRARVIVASAAGGRAFVFEDRAHRTNAFSTVGALRDDVAIQPPPSTTDRIAKYTHTFSAGTFNRPYRVVRRREMREVMLAYEAPDVVPGGARFEKTLVLEGDVLRVRERFAPRGAAPEQRLEVLSSLAIGRTAAEPWRPPVLLPLGEELRPHTTLALPLDAPFGLYDPLRHEFVAVGWSAGALEKAELVVEDRHAVLRLRYAPGTQTTCYEYAYVGGEAEARARVAGAAHEGDGSGGVAERSTQSPQKRPGESPCGFKSHLPH